MSEAQCENAMQAIDRELDRLRQVEKNYTKLAEMIARIKEANKRCGGILLTNAIKEILGGE